MEIEMKCIMGELDHPNRNGIIYDSGMMKNAIDKWKHEGQREVELEPDYEYIHKHNMSKIAGKIEDICINNGEIYGKVQLLDTPSGKIMQHIVQSGIDMHIGPRMFGDKVSVLDEDGNQKIDENGNPIYEVKNVKIVSWDIVK